MTGVGGAGVLVGKDDSNATAMVGESAGAIVGRAASGSVGVILADGAWMGVGRTGGGVGEHAARARSSTDRIATDAIADFTFFLLAVVVASSVRRIGHRVNRNERGR